MRYKLKAWDEITYVVEAKSEEEALAFPIPRENRRAGVEIIKPKQEKTGEDMKRLWCFIRTLGKHRWVVGQYGAGYGTHCYYCGRGV